MKKTWQIQEAKSRFSELIDRAQTEGVQIVTRRGIESAAVLSYRDFERLTQRKGSLARFLLDSPLAGSEILLDRVAGMPGEIQVEE